MWKGSNEIIDIDAYTERKIGGMKAQNSQVPMSNIILNLVMFTTEILKRSSEFRTVHEIPKPKVFADSFIN